MTTHDTAQATDVPRGFFSVDSQMLAVEIGHHAGMAFGGTPGPFHMTVEAMIDAAFKVRERKLEAELAAAEAERDALAKENADLRAKIKEARAYLATLSDKGEAENES